MMMVWPVVMWLLWAALALGILCVVTGCTHPAVQEVLGAPVVPGTAVEGTVVRGNARPDPLDVTGHRGFFSGLMLVELTDVEMEGGSK